MELPSEIWEKIILQIKNAKHCIKLYDSLPKSIQKYLKNKYNDHLKLIQNKILYSIDNSMILAVENKKYFVSVDKMGTIIFWDAKTHQFFDSIEIGNEIQNIEFHPSKTKLVVSVIQENLGLEIQSLTLSTHGIIFNETIIAYERNFSIKIVYHPTFPYILLIRYKLNQIYSIYLWNYDSAT